MRLTARHAAPGVDCNPLPQGITVGPVSVQRPAQHKMEVGVDIRRQCDRNLESLCEARLL